MSTTTIEWTATVRANGEVVPGFTFNPWIGCAKVSPGCQNCYASVDTFARRSRANGHELWGADAERHVTSDQYWKQPLKWDRDAADFHERRRVFCASLADVAEDRPDLVAPRRRLMLLIAKTPNLDWLLLTKRPENLARLFDWSALGCRDSDEWPSNVWIGTTVEDRARLSRVEALLSIPCATRFVSYEPALEAVDFGPYMRGPIVSLDWVIVGGESGPQARPFDLAWARGVVNAPGRLSAVFVKQFGSRPSSVADKITHHGDAARFGNGTFARYLNDKKGGDMSEWPADLRVREFPKVASDAR